jgi:transposase
MTRDRTYYPPTTAQQRRLLFEVWEETGDRAEACRRAHVSQSTFYNWKARYDAGGYAALDEPRSHARLFPGRAPPEVGSQVVALRQEHPEWGKRRIADELAKGNNWTPLVSPNTVKRMLQDAGLWPPAESRAKKGGPKAASAQPKRQGNR